MIRGVTGCTDYNETVDGELVWKTINCPTSGEDISITITGVNLIDTVRISRMYYEEECMNMFRGWVGLWQWRPMVRRTGIATV